MIRPSSPLTMLLSRYTRRREFITLLGGAAAARPLAVHAQQGERMRRIGVLQAVSETDPEAHLRKTAFVGSLQKLGWTEGANVTIDYRWAGADADRIRLYAIEITGLRPDVIWTSGALPLLPLKRATRTVPIVFTQVYDPIGSGFVASLTRPGGNITGFTLGEFSMGSLAADLVSRQVTVIAALSSPAALAAKAATSTIPVVFNVGVDPVRAGLVPSLNRPGGNITGVTFFATALEPKRLGLLRELIPQADLVAVLMNPNYPDAEVQLKDVREATLANERRS